MKFITYLTAFASLCLVTPQIASADKAEFVVNSTAVKFFTSPINTMIEDYAKDIEIDALLSCMITENPDQKEETLALFKDVVRFLLAEYSLSGSPGYNDINSDTLFKQARSIFKDIVFSLQFPCFKGKEKLAVDGFSRIFATHFLALAFNKDAKLVQNVAFNSAQLNKTLIDFGEAVKTDTGFACPDPPNDKFNPALRRLVSDYLSLMVRGLLAQTLTAHTALREDGNALVASFDRLAHPILFYIDCVDINKALPIVRKYFSAAVLDFALKSGPTGPKFPVTGVGPAGVLTPDGGVPDGGNPPPPDGQGGATEPAGPTGPSGAGASPGTPVAPDNSDRGLGNAADKTPTGCSLNSTGAVDLFPMKSSFEMFFWIASLLLCRLLQLRLKRTRN